MEAPSPAEYRVDEKVETELINNRQTGDEILARTRVYAHFRSDFSISGAEPFELDDGHYRLARLLILRPVMQGGPNGEKYELLAQMGSSDQDDQSMIRTRPGMGMVFPLNGIRIKPSWRDKLDRFEARPDRVAEWVISLPEGVATAVEKKLKAEGNAVTAS